MGIAQHLAADAHACFAPFGFVHGEISEHHWRKVVFRFSQKMMRKQKA
jgi:hypothetical protein